MLEETGPGLWTRSAPLRLLGADMGTRMTVVRVGDDGLVLIAPVEIDESVAAELAGLGEVRALIAPNAFHHFYFEQAADRYPEAACFLAEGVAGKLENPPARAVSLGAAPDALWEAELEQIRIEGAPRVNEVVFYHGATRTLILTDLCFHFDPPPRGWDGWVLRLFGAHGRLAVSRLMRTLLRERGQVRASIEQVLEWDVDRIIVTHGRIVERDGKRLLREATADL